MVHPASRDLTNIFPYPGYGMPSHMCSSCLRHYTSAVTLTELTLVHASTPCREQPYPWCALKRMAFPTRHSLHVAALAQHIGQPTNKLISAHAPDYELLVYLLVLQTEHPEQAI